MFPPIRPTRQEIPVVHCTLQTTAVACYTEKAPNAWHRRGTQKTGNTYNQPNRPNQRSCSVWFDSDRDRTVSARRSSSLSSRPGEVSSSSAYDIAPRGRDQCPRLKRLAVIQLAGARLRLYQGKLRASVSWRARRRRHKNGGCARDSKVETVRCAERGWPGVAENNQVTPKTSSRSKERNARPAGSTMLDPEQ